MGADGGTGGIRVGLYDLAGHEIAFASAEYKTVYEHPGWAEQKPEDWWQAFKGSCRDAIKKAGIDKSRILSLAIDTHNPSPVLCKMDGTPVRDCLIWMDVRASKEAEEIYNKTGVKILAEWMASKLLWLKKNEPENYENAEVICDYLYWMNHRLTGTWTAIYNNVALWGYDIVKKKFNREFYKKIGLEGAVDKFQVDDISYVGDKISAISKWAAADLGLPEDTIIARGGTDSPISVLGMGVCKPGKIALITGSSHVAISLLDKPFSGRGGFSSTPDTLVKGYYSTSGGQASTGSILTWFKREFCGDLNADEKNGGMNTYKRLDADAAKVPPGSEGLVILEYWQGNRVPYMDGAVRGMIYGLSLNHTRSHLFRAIMEGIAYGTENILMGYRQNGNEVKEICIGGGAANSDLYMQIHADVSNVVVNVPEQMQACCTGCAICAAAAAGVYGSISEAAENMIRYKKTIEPNPENHAIYREIFNQYYKIYPELKDWMHETTALYTNSLKAK
jgi:sugar (pentulose or hexulose) kinase